MTKGFIPHGTEFRASSFINTGNYTWQVGSSVAGLADGGYVVAWTSQGQDGNGNGIFGQYFNSKGTALGGEFQINTTWNLHQEAPSIAALDDGGFVVAWQSSGGSGVGYSIIGQRYDAKGKTVGGEFAISDPDTASQGAAIVTVLDDGSFVVTWNARDQDGDSWGIFARRFDKDGVAEGAEFQVNTYTLGVQTHPTVSALNDGSFVVTWASWQDGDKDGIYGQRYDAVGNAVGSEFQVNTYTAGYQSGAKVAGLVNGGFMVMWNGEGAASEDNGIFAQRFDYLGRAAGTQFQVNSHTSDLQSDQEIVALADGGFVATWMSLHQDGDRAGIYGQRFDAGGDAVGKEFQINTFTDDGQDYPAIAALANGGFVVTWDSGDHAGNDDGIYGQQFAAQLFGTSLNDTMYDEIGANWMDGQGGDDLLLGQGGRDVVYGGAGNDIIKGGSGHDKLSGGKGEDILRGGKGNDKMQGDGGKDKIKGEAGNDQLDGGKGRDKLTGGAGEDTFVFKVGYGRDKITDFKDDIDTLQFDQSMRGGLTPGMFVINKASIVDGDVVFDFGTDKLTLKGITDIGALIDDIEFI
ncbi:MAG: hypothetical protein KUG74_12845 [Rhodobacteraceae bacterium]|nr:hypothetical protein [Paracoccaceae bacterium]